MIGAQGEYDAEAIDKLHQKFNKRTAITLPSFREQLFKLIHDQQSFCSADRQIAADRVSSLTRVRGIDALSQGGALVWTTSEPLRRFSHPPFQALDRVAARAHYDDVPYPVVRLAARGIGECSAAKSRNKPSLSERGLARAAVRYDCNQPIALQF